MANVNCETGIALWNKAKKLIPGGSQLLSKRAEQFLPDRWPAYYQKASGTTVWDLDGNKFTDMSYMGIGACILGYCDPDVDAAVKNAIDNCSMNTLNCPEEVELAELLLRIHPWAGSVRYARTGGESMAIAVRIARAHARREKVAFCGYHGWSDWYLATNLADGTNLDQHLLSGLDPNGVPTGLSGTAIPFNYNAIEELQAVVEKNDIGVIVVEPTRHTEPKPEFLKQVREIADEINAVLIFDEITIGWRMTIGGYHHIAGVIPDIAVYAKAMSNGYPMGAVVGKSEVLDAAQTSFISSTYWTERIGPTAAIATINKLESENVPSHLDEIGQAIGAGWKELAEKHGLDISILPPTPLVTMAFNYDEPLVIKTLFTQEMLKRGYLAVPSVYVSNAHTIEQVNAYMEQVDEVFGIIKAAIDNQNLMDLLEGPVAHSGFQRLT
jgi:glutamate-1-semialdehyde aminotransferase